MSDTIDFRLKHNFDEIIAGLNKARDAGAKTEKQNKKTGSSVDSLTASFAKARGAASFLGSQFSKLDVLGIGLTFSFGSLISSAMGVIKEMSALGDEMTYLSDASGSTGEAVGAVFAAAGNSLGSIDTIKGAIKSLADQGITSVSTLKGLASAAGNLQQMTGIAASEWGNLTGELNFKYGIPEKGIRNITSALIGSGLKGQNLTKVMGSLNKIISSTAFISKNTQAGIESLTRSLSTSVGVMSKMGISAETAGSFLEGMMDPEKFEENAAALARMGISAEEYAMSLEGANGQATLMNKIMSNLPGLANQISAIGNPLARMKVAKSLGIPMEIASKMAGKTQQEIEDMMATYQEKVKGDEALKKKEEKAKAEAKKLDDAIDAMKRRALAPMVAFLSQNMTKIFAIANVFVTVASKIVGIFAKFADAFLPHIDGFIAGINKFFIAMEPVVNWITNSLTGFIKGIGEILTEGINSDSVGSAFSKMMDKGWEMVKEGIKKIFAGGLEAWDKSGTLGKLAMVGGGFMAAKSVLGMLSGRGKTISNATVGDLADAIGEAVAEKTGLLGRVKGVLSNAFTKTLVLGTGGFLLAKSLAEKLGVKGAGSNAAGAAGAAGALRYANPFSAISAFKNIKAGQSIGAALWGATGPGKLIADVGKLGKGLMNVGKFAKANPITGAIFGGLEGAFRSDEIQKSISFGIGRAAGVASRGIGDDYADFMSSTVGGGLTLGLGFLFDDVSELVTGKKTNIGKQITKVVGEIFPFTSALRTLAPVFNAVGNSAKAASEYTKSMSQVRDKFHEIEMKRYQEQAKKKMESGDIFGAIADNVGIGIGKLKNKLFGYFSDLLEGIRSFIDGLIVNAGTGDGAIASFIRDTDTFQKANMNQMARAFDKGKNTEVMALVNSTTATSGQLSAKLAEIAANKNNNITKETQKNLVTILAEAKIQKDKEEMMRAEQLKAQKEANKQLGGIGAGIDKLNEKETPQQPRENQIYDLLTVASISGGRVATS